MKSNFLKNKIGGILLGIALVLGVVITTGISVQAQNRGGYYPQDQNDRYDRNRRDRRDNRGQNQRRWGRNNDGYGNYGGSFDLRQTALNEGFNEGLKEGRNDRRRGEYGNYTDEKEFQKGTKSYSSRLGDRGIYQAYFREAFSHGYADGYAGY